MVILLNCIPLYVALFLSFLCPLRNLELLFSVFFPVKIIEMFNVPGLHAQGSGVSFGNKMDLLVFSSHLYRELSIITVMNNCLV